MRETAHLIIWNIFECHVKSYHKNISKICYVSFIVLNFEKKHFESNEIVRIEMDFKHYEFIQKKKKKRVLLIIYSTIVFSWPIC